MLRNSRVGIVPRCFYTTQVKLWGLFYVSGKVNAILHSESEGKLEDSKKNERGRYGEKEREKRKQHR